METGEIEVVQGSDVTCRVTFKDDTGTPLDLVPVEEVKFAVYLEAPTQGTVPAILKKKTLSQITFPNGGADGVADVALLSADTQSIIAGSYWWQIMGYMGTKYRISKVGTFEILKAGPIVSA